MVRAGSSNFLQLPLLFWVLSNCVIEALLHPPHHTLNQLRQGSGSEGIGPSAYIAVPACAVNVVVPAWGLSPGDTVPKELQANNPLNISFCL
jgi:hypothetical protein